MNDNRGFRSDPSGRPPDLSPADVQTRLTELRRIAVIERDEAARARLEQEQRARPEPFALAAQRRLRELHALCAMARYLHRVVPGPRHVPAQEPGPT